jgi:hypothetical protein
MTGCCPSSERCQIYRGPQKVRASVAEPYHFDESALSPGKNFDAALLKRMPKLLK